jgi:WD40 repeat protein
MNVKRITLSLLLSTTTLFCSEKEQRIIEFNKNHSLEHYALEQCKINLSESNTQTEDINNYLNTIPEDKKKEKLFNYLKKNKLSALTKEIDNHKTNLCQNFTIHNTASQTENPLSFYCQKTAINSVVSDSQITPPLIQREGSCQKVLAKYTNDNNLCILRMPFTEIINPWDPLDGIHLNCQKKLSFYNTQTLKTYNETASYYEIERVFYRPTQYAYQNEPLYILPEQKFSPQELWLQKHQLDTHLALFSDNSLIVTYVWGGVELHKHDSLTSFMVPHTISAVDCSPNGKYIAFGGYDASLTIMDTTQESSEIYANRRFIDYFPNEKNLIQINPLRIHKGKGQSAEAITKVQFCNNGNNLLFSSGKKLFSVSVGSNQNECPHKRIFEAKNIIKSFNYSNNTLVLIFENNEIIRVDIRDLNNSTIDFSNEKAVFHTSAINTICAYPEKDQQYLITGDDDGNVIIWDINENNLIAKITLPHHAPVHSVEVSPDKKFFVVKTTNVNNGGIIKDDLFFYPTPAYLSDYTQDQLETLNTLTAEYNNNKDNPTKLYALICGNKFFFCSKIGQSLADEISKQILLKLTDQPFVDSIKSLDELKKTLDFFHQNPDKEHVFTSKTTPIETHSLIQLDNDIEKTFATIIAKIIIDEFEKAQNNKIKQQELYNFVNLYKDIIEKSSKKELLVNLNKLLKPSQEVEKEKRIAKEKEENRLRKIEAEKDFLNSTIPTIKIEFETHKNNLFELYNLYIKYKSCLKQFTNPTIIQLYQDIQDQLASCLQNDEDRLSSINSIDTLYTFLENFKTTIRGLKLKLITESFRGKQPLSCNTVGEFEQLLGCVAMTVILEEFVKNPNDKDHQQIVFNCFLELSFFARIIPPILQKKLKAKVQHLFSKGDLQFLFPEKSLREKIISFATDNTIPLIVAAIEITGIAAGYWAYLFFTNKK